MKFGQLTEHNMGNIFLEKLYTKCGGKLVRETCLKSQNWAYIISGSIVKFYTDCFYCMSSWGLSQYIEPKLQGNCFYLM